MEENFSYKNLHSKCNEFSLPFSPFISILIYLIFNFYCYFVVAGLEFHAWSLGFHGGTSIHKVMDSPFPSHFSFIFCFAYLFSNVYCCCRFNGERRNNDIFGGFSLMHKSNSWVWIKEYP